MRHPTNFSRPGDPSAPDLCTPVLRCHVVCSCADISRLLSSTYVRPRYTDIFLVPSREHRPYPLRKTKQLARFTETIDVLPSESHRQHKCTVRHNESFKTQVCVYHLCTNHNKCTFYDDVRLCMSVILSTYMFRSLVWPSTGCSKA
jgi:hypothetical protein